METKQYGQIWPPSSDHQNQINTALYKFVSKYNAKSVMLHLHIWMSNYKLYLNCIKS